MKVEALPIEKSVHAKTMLDEVQCFCLPVLRATRHRAPGERVGAIDESERRKNGAFFAEYDMSTKSAAPFHGVVHAWQVVEQQRSGVEVLECDGELLRVQWVKPVRNCHLKNKPGPDQASRVIEHMTERVFKVWIQSRRK